MLPRFTRSLMLSGALLFPAFAANAEPASSPRIELAQYPYYGQRPPAEVDDYGTPGGRQDEAGLSVRVDHLESQLRSLTGQLEQAQFQVRKLQEQLTKFQQDIEFRFQEAPHGPAARSGVQRRSEFRARASNNSTRASRRRDPGHLRLARHGRHAARRCLRSGERPERTRRTAPARQHLVDRDCDDALDHPRGACRSADGSGL